MKFGFIKVAAASPRLKVADCPYNASEILRVLAHAREQGVRVLVLPELSMTGYTCGDLFLQKTLLDGMERSLADVVNATRHWDGIAVVGAPVSKLGKLYNCAVVMHRGKILGVVPKTHLPNYNEFYERRHFNPAPEETDLVSLAGQENIPFGTRLIFCCEEVEELKLAVEICEDLWAPVQPSVSHTAAGATLILNLSASDETVGKEEYRRMLVTGQSARLLCGYVYCDAGEGESTTDMVFAGHNLIAENGVLLQENRRFSGEWAVTEVDVQRLEMERRKNTTFHTCEEGYQYIPFHLHLEETPLTRTIPALPFIPADTADRESRCEDILTIQSMGLKKRLAHSHAKTAVIGISGGLDSCLALLVAAKAMDLLKRPRTDVIAVTMPCFGTTARTKGNAEKLSELLGVELRQVDIKAAVEQHFADIGHDPDNHNVVYENSQARERTQIIMDIANETSGLVVGTGDLSELALGWATYNGDHMSMYGVNASIPKTLIRHIVKYVADHGALDCKEQAALRDVLYDILDTPVSPELLPPSEGEIAQKTEDIVGPYELHDFYLYYGIRWGFTPSKVFHLACHAFQGVYDRDTILQWLSTFYRRFFAQQFKRSCVPDGPKVGSVSLSPRGDWRMPSDACWTLWQQEVEDLQEQ
ncbi:MAG: NAD(+) synthase [Eubacteriales bacterium]|jgi:NAD+ synthase (glutamine-hydrolysing)